MDDQIKLGLTIIVPGLERFNKGELIDDLDPEKIIATLAPMVRDICERAKAETNQPPAPSEDHPPHQAEAQPPATQESPETP